MVVLRCYFKKLKFFFLNMIKPINVYTFFKLKQFIECHLRHLNPSMF